MVLPTGPVRAPDAARSHNLSSICSPSGWGSIPCGGAVMFCESVALMLRATKWDHDHRCVRIDEPSQVYGDGLPHRVPLMLHWGLIPRAS